MRVSFLAGAFAVFGCCGAMAQDGDLSRGRAAARELCASCHAVEPGGAVSPDAAAPPFALIANTPGMSAPALNSVLHSSHQSMPNIILEPEDRADVLAYILSLKN